MSPTFRAIAPSNVRNRPPPPPPPIKFNFNSAMIRAPPEPPLSGVTKGLDSLNKNLEQFAQYYCYVTSNEWPTVSDISWTPTKYTIGRIGYTIT